MKRVVAVPIVLCLMMTNLFGQTTSLLDKFDFSSPGYSIIIRPLDGGISARSDTMMHVSYYDQMEHLEALKEALELDQPATVYPFACFDEYDLLVVKEAKLLERWTVSWNCHSIGCGEREVAFEGYLPFKGYKVAGRVTASFDDIVKARAHLKHIEQQSGLLYISEPRWRDYEGEFMIMREHVRISKEAQRAEFESMIAKTFPGEVFKIVSHLGSGDSETGYTFWADVFCNQSLYDKFKLDNVKSFMFEPFPLKLESFWRK